MRDAAHQQFPGPIGVEVDNLVARLNRLKVHGHFGNISRNVETDRVISATADDAGSQRNSIIGAGSNRYFGERNRNPNP